MAFEAKHSSYLGLPMEIRQKILHYTITDEDLEADTDINHRRYDHFIKGVTWCMEVVKFNGSATMFWADMLKTVHSVVEDDMWSVMKRWKTRGQELADQNTELECNRHIIMLNKLADVQQQVQGLHEQTLIT
ncbi:hypothetical protein FKW77_006373 [Venturia effusa]|uniref:Uncharacterized protein n=1 Tax=Venturia effusa TaxID=50376 RepID=A0A517LN54_9PEZI|nr:hypothetical protein FKW77_006373 [Venturia effusa]